MTFIRENGEKNQGLAGNALAGNIQFIKFLISFTVV